MAPESWLNIESPLDRLVNENVHHLITLAQIYRELRDSLIDKVTAEAQVDALCDTITLLNGFHFSEPDRNQLKRPIRSGEGLNKPMALADQLVQMLVWKSISDPRSQGFPPSEAI